MTVAIAPVLRPYTPDLIVMPDSSQETNPASYKDVADANDHLHAVLKALLKERSGQPLTEAERRTIELHVAAQKWQLEHTIIHTEQS